MSNNLIVESSKKGLAFIVSAPAGTGKTTLVSRLIKEFPQVIASLSFTTRKPRMYEEDGVDYRFISDEQFQKRVEANDFLEHVSLYDTKYGTSREWVEEKRCSGKHVVLVIDTQGALQLKDRYDAIYIFIKPPSMEELRRRLMFRNTEDETTIAKRLNLAENELEQAQNYDYQIINDKIESAYEVLKSIVIAECHKTSFIQ